MMSLKMTETTQPQKSMSAFRTISEVAEDLGVQQHVLRFWETKFTQVKPMKRGGGRRYYRPEDVALLKKIHSLLYVEGYTIKGVQKLLKGVSKSQVMAEQKQTKVLPQAEGIIPKAHGQDIPQVSGPDVKEIVESMSSEEQKAMLQSVLNELMDMRAQLQVFLTAKADAA